MATTSFTDGSTVIVASWLNEVDALVHDIFNGPDLLSLHAKGDVLASNGTTLQLVNVGSNDQVLTAASGEDAGVKWAAAGGDVVDDTTPQLGGFLDTNGKFISMSQGVAIASEDGDTDIWAGVDGNTIHITGTDTITDFGTPKRAGNYMWLIFDAAAVVQDSATITVAGNTNYQAAANDLAIVYALTTSSFLFIPFPNSGSSPVAASGGLEDAGGNIVGVENHITTAGNFTVTNTKNLVTGGPFTIAAGHTVTVGAGETWTVV
jgi:hypothetical protein